MVKIEVSLILSVLLLSTAVLGECPDKGEAMEYLLIENSLQFHKLYTAMQEVHKIGEKIKHIQLSPSTKEPYWQFFFDEAENRSTIAGLPSYEFTLKYSHHVKQFTTAIEKHHPGIKNEIEKVVKELEPFATLKIGGRMKYFEKEFDVPFHDCKWKETNIW